MKKAFTTVEVIIVLVIIGTIAAAMFSALHSADISTSACKKAGAKMYFQIDFATKQLLAKYSRNYSMKYLKKLADGKEFSITDSNADAELIKLYKKTLVATRKNSQDASYLSAALKDEAGTNYSSLKVNSFPQRFTLKNGGYFGLKLNGNCTTSESYIYSPSQTTKRTALRSCGLIFFDINGDSAPNTLGVDQYIISISAGGLR